MEGFVNVNPKPKSFATTIEIPIHDLFVISSSKDIHYWENAFCVARDKAQEVKSKRECDRCRATLKWASACNASSVKVSDRVNAYGHNFNAIEFTFEFTELEHLMEFVNNLKACVTDATM